MSYLWVRQQLLDHWWRHQRDDATLPNLPACHLFGCGNSSPQSGRSGSDSPTPPPPAPPAQSAQQIWTVLSIGISNHLGSWHIGCHAANAGCPQCFKRARIALDCVQFRLQAMTLQCFKKDTPVFTRSKPVHTKHDVNPTVSEQGL